MLQIDHIGIAARDASASAHQLAYVLGAGEVTVDGADGDMFRVELDHGVFVLFNPATKIDLAHVAFHVDRERFTQVLERLRARDIPFGNDPDAITNGQSDDPLGGHGRLYYLDPSGHLFEVTC